MKQFLLAIAIPLALTHAALADDADAKRAEAQRRIDEGKLKGCQSLKSMLVGNKSCPDQAKAAAAMTCTVQSYNDMAALQHACAGALKTKADAMKSGSGSGSGSAAPPPATGAAKCTITKIAGQDVSIDLPITHKMFADTWCKTSVRTEAEKWLKTHASCPAGKTTFPYTFTFGVPGKEASFDQSGYCPRTR
jgi:hypothetical protein